MARRPVRTGLEAGSETDGYRLFRRIADALALLTGRLAGGERYFLPTPFAEWFLAHVPAAATLATISRASGGPGTRHYVTGISGSYSAAQVGTLRLLTGTGVGAVAIGTFHVHNAQNIEFASPIEIPADTAVTADLSAGAAAVVGAVVLRGYTVTE